jgi:hypothetical protein
MAIGERKSCSAFWATSGRGSHGLQHFRRECVADRRHSTMLVGFNAHSRQEII